FSVEHPIFTCRKEPGRYYEDHGTRRRWPVDRYHSEGMRQTGLLTENVSEDRRTVSTYMDELLRGGFKSRAVKEPVPPEKMLMRLPEMKDEWRRPMFLIISAEKT